GGPGGAGGGGRARPAPARRGCWPGVPERGLPELAGGQSLPPPLQLFEPSARLRFSGARGRKLSSERLLAAGRSSHGGSRGLQILFEGFDRRFLAHETLSDLRHLTLEVADPMGRRELIPDERARR